MISRDDALKKINEITNGSGVDRDQFTDKVRRGQIAIEFWNDPRFSLGFEYGFVCALVDVFNITREEIDAKSIKQANVKKDS